MKPRGGTSAIRRRSGKRRVGKRRAGRRRRRNRRYGTGRVPALHRRHPPPEPEAGYAEGYREGRYDGGEKLLEERLPPDAIVPGVSLEEVIDAGVRAVLSRRIPLRTPETVYEEIERALTGRTPYSLVRLGDGELLTLSQDTVIPAQAVHREGPFLPNAGLDAPDPTARDELAAVLPRASLIGVPLSRRPHFQPLLFAVAASIGLPLERLPLTSSLVNFSLYEQGYLMRLLANRRVLVIGNEAAPLAQALSDAGIEVTGAVQPVDGMGDVGRIVEEGMRHTFDLALVSAGIAAVPICVHLAERTGRVALDFGHAANVMSGVPARAKPAREAEATG